MVGIDVSFQDFSIFVEESTQAVSWIDLASKNLNIIAKIHMTDRCLKNENFELNDVWWIDYIIILTII